jgi:hypothetical protein
MVDEKNDELPLNEETRPLKFGASVQMNFEFEFEQTTTTPPHITILLL